MPVLPWAIAALAVTVWHLRTAIPTRRTSANGTAVSGFPLPYDAKNWDELTESNNSVRQALTFWSRVNKMEPDFLLPTWIELTGTEQKMVVDAFANGDPSQLRQVVQLSMRRAEPKREDAEMRHTALEIAEQAARGV